LTFSPPTATGGRHDLPSVISLYGADDEERLAFQEQEYFLSNLRIGHGLRAKFDVACFALTQFWREDPQKFGLRAVLHELRFG